MPPVIVVLALAVAGCAGDRAPAGASERDAVAAVREQGARWLAAVRAEDAASLAAIYADDAVFLPPGAPALVGRDTIRALFEGQFAAMDAEYEFAIEGLEAAGDWAWRRGRYRVDARLAGGGTLSADDKFVEIWRRGADGRWRIALDIWNSNRAPAGGS